MCNEGRVCGRESNMGTRIDYFISMGGDGTVDCQVCCKVRLNHYYGCCTLFLWYINHPTYNLECILETHLRENEHIDH